MTAFGDGHIPGTAPPSWEEAYARLYHDGRAEFPPACLHYVETVVRQAALAPRPSFADETTGDEVETRETTAPQGVPGTRGIRDTAAAEVPAGAGSLPPAAVIAAFRNALRRDFGPLREAVLREWGMLTPFDLGRAIGALGHVDRLSLDDGDAPEFYARDPVPLTETTDQAPPGGVSA